MLHFTWVFTECQNTCLGVSSIQRVKNLFYCSAVRAHNSVCSVLRELSALLAEHDYT